MRREGTSEVLTPGDTAPPLLVEDAGGARVVLPGPASHRLVAFVRPLESPLGRQAVRELAEARPALLAAGADLVVICPSERGRSLEALEASGLRLVPDPDGALAAAWGMGRDPLGLYTLRGLTQRDVSLRRVARAVRDGGALGGLRNPLLPAEILVDARGRVAWVHLACSRLAPPDLKGALDALRGAAPTP